MPDCRQVHPSLSPALAKTVWDGEEEPAQQLPVITICKAVHKSQPISDQPVQSNEKGNLLEIYVQLFSRLHSLPNLTPAVSTPKHSNLIVISLPSII